MALTVSRILHAGYVFGCDGVEIAFDPIFEAPFSVNCHPWPEVRFDRDAVRALRLAAVFVSHHHDDHCSLASLDLLDRRTPIHLYCAHEEMFALIRALGFTDVRALVLDRPVIVGPFEVVPRLALDPDVDAVFEVHAGGVRVLNVVDAWLDPRTVDELARRAPWDLVLWPFQTMREIDVLSPARAEPASRALPPEWLEQLAALAPRWVVPSSCQLRFEPWSWYNRAFFPITYAQFAREVERAVRLNPSRSVVLDVSALRPAPPLPWVQPIGEQDVDYDFDPALVAPPTCEIARHFPALTPIERARVMRYVESELLERHAAIGPSDEAYFDRPRRWRLSLHDHAGEATHLDYVVDGERLTRAAFEVPEWTTEVPIAKLHGALEHGEPATSMYLRINDDPRLAPGADVLADPLLRCLFSGVFGAYQRAQLRAIRAADSATRSA